RQRYLIIPRQGKGELLMFSRDAESAERSVPLRKSAVKEEVEEQAATTVAWSARSSRVTVQLPLPMNVSAVEHDRKIAGGSLLPDEAVLRMRKIPNALQMQFETRRKPFENRFQFVLLFAKIPVRRSSHLGKPHFDKNGRLIREHSGNRFADGVRIAQCASAHGITFRVHAPQRPGPGSLIR